MRGRWDEPKSGEITPEDLYAGRRAFLKNAALYVGASTALGAGLVALTGGFKSLKPAAPNVAPEPLPLASAAGASPIAHTSAYDTDEPKTAFEDVTSYNNFYELGYGKEDPAENASLFKPRPWTVSFEGEIAKPLTLDVDDLQKRAPLEERVYRMRCVETWSMVIPWLGLPLGALVKQLEPTSRAKYVAFESVYRPSELPGQRRRVLDWPYVEGLRIDEAMHPLTLLVLGLYGKTLPNQNGAPVRLVVPWKYGFKGIKSIVKVRFVEEQPKTTWSGAAPDEYGFYANVNPRVDHPRWSQATERRIGDVKRRPTLPFNGYQDLVAGMYAGMDLRKDF